MIAGSTEIRSRQSTGGFYIPRLSSAGPSCVTTTAVSHPHLDTRLLVLGMLGIPANRQKNGGFKRFEDVLNFLRSAGGLGEARRINVDPEDLNIGANPLSSASSK